MIEIVFLNNCVTNEDPSLFHVVGPPVRSVRSLIELERFGGSKRPRVELPGPLCGCFFGKAREVVLRHTCLL